MADRLGLEDVWVPVEDHLFYGVQRIDVLFSQVKVFEHFTDLVILVL